MLQAWTLPPFNPPADVRIEDNLQRKGLLAPSTPSAPPRAAVASATVEILGRVDDEQRMVALRDWLHRDLQLAFRAPPPTLDAFQLNILMANPADPVKAIRDSVLFTRGWYEAPQQMEAERDAATHRALGF